MKLPQKFKRLALLAGAIVTLSACSDDVASVSLGLFTTKDVVVNSQQDPIVEGVTCHISHIEANLDFSDPSDMSIACRQTGPITAQQLQKIDRSKSGEVIFKSSKSILFNLRSLRIESRLLFAIVFSI